MGEVVVVRHGETVWSRDGRHTGLTDVPLTPTGEQQAASVGATLHGRSFALVLSSPLSRALRTAEIAGFNPLVDDDLHEWDYGGYEGLTTAQIRAQLGHQWTIFADGVPAGATPGETLADVGRRADRVIARAQEQLPDGDVLLFSHGHLLRVLAARWVGEAPSFGARFALGTATNSQLGTEHGLPVVQEWNRVPG